MTFGENKKYPDDFSLNCPVCDNWEEGALPTQGFDVLERLDDEKHELTKGDVLIMTQGIKDYSIGDAYSGFLLIKNASKEVRALALRF